MYQIISIGAAVLDIYAQSEQFITDDKFLSLLKSSKNEISSGNICCGGGAANSSVTFSRLGLKSACLALVGDDVLRLIVRHHLYKNGVSRRLIIENKNDTTDYSIILVANDGTRSVLTNRGSTRLETKMIKFSKLKDTKWFYITSLEGNIDLLEKLIGFAKESNIKVSLNPGRRELKKISQIRSLFQFVEFLQFNTEEAQIATGESFDSPRFWSVIESFGAKITAVTNGRDGAYIFTQGTVYYSPVLNDRPVDETGAGDAFGSAFVAALFHGRDPQKALFWGIKNSASVVSHLGAQTGILTYNKIIKKYVAKTRKKI